MGLDFLLQKVKDAIFSDPRTEYKQGDQHGLIAQVENLFGQHSNSGNDRNIRPASEDPHGDPGNQDNRFRNARPASEDPYGDPADARG